MSDSHRGGGLLTLGGWLLRRDLADEAALRRVTMTAALVLITTAVVCFATYRPSTGLGLQIARVAVSVTCVAGGLLGVRSGVAAAGLSASLLELAEHQRVMRSVNLLLPALWEPLLLSLLVLPVLAFSANLGGMTTSRLPWVVLLITAGGVQSTAAGFLAAKCLRAANAALAATVLAVGVMWLRGRGVETLFDPWPVSSVLQTLRVDGEPAWVVFPASLAAVVLAVLVPARSSSRRTVGGRGVRRRTRKVAAMSPHAWKAFQFHLGGRTGVLLRLLAAFVAAAALTDLTGLPRASVVIVFLSAAVVEWGFVSARRVRMEMEAG